MVGVAGEEKERGSRGEEEERRKEEVGGNGAESRVEDTSRGSNDDVSGGVKEDGAGTGIEWVGDCEQVEGREEVAMLLCVI